VRESTVHAGGSTGPSAYEKPRFGAMKVIRVGPRPGARTTARRPNPPEFTARRSAVRGRLRRVGSGRPGAHP
jgi:hypothetical protein